MSIGTNLKQALKRNNMTVAELSRKTGIKEQTLHSIIRRDSSQIKVENLFAIVNAIPTLSLTELTALEDLSRTEQEVAIGENIRALRRRTINSDTGKAYTQIELAKKSGIATSTLQRYERGETSPTNYALNKIAKALDVAVVELLISDEEKEVKMDGLEAIQTLNDLSLNLDENIKKLAAQGIKQAHAERLYKMELREQALKLKAQDMPVTLIDKVVLGVPSVADRRLERDIAEAEYKATQEVINGIKLQMRILDNQVQREWGQL